MSHIFISNEDDFTKLVLENTSLVFVEFYADWSIPCKMLDPVLDEISEIFLDKLDILKIHIDEFPGKAQDYDVICIPLLILFKSGKEILRHSGIADKDFLVNLLKKHLQ